MTSQSHPTAPVLLYKVDDVARLLNVSRTVVFALLRTRRLRSVSEGRARRIPAAALDDYLELLDRESSARAV
jgi:excisionase family DNA binding protein